MDSNTYVDTCFSISGIKNIEMKHSVVMINPYSASFAHNKYYLQYYSKFGLITIHRSWKLPSETDPYEVMKLKVSFRKLFREQ